MGLTEEQVQQIQAITRTRDPNDRSVQTRVQHSVCISNTPYLWISVHELFKYSFVFFYSIETRL